MRQWLRVVVTGASVWTLMALLPFAMSSARAQNEILLNSSIAQVVHNVPANTDVLNLSLNVTSNGDAGSCNSEADDLLETGVHVSVSRLSCGAYSLACECVVDPSTSTLSCFSSVLCTTESGFCGGICPAFDFDAQVNYVEHQIGESSYGTSFALNAAGSVSSKIVALATPALTCGTWSINLQATGQNLSAITSTPVALFLNDSNDDGDGGIGAACFDVNVNIGNGLVKPHHGVHRARH